MRKKLLYLREQLLQKFADFIYSKLQDSKNEREFDYWMWQGLKLDYWCVERNIYLS